MQYGDVQARIIERCDNRSDLEGIVQSSIQERIDFWSEFLFYSGDVQDSSIVTQPGTYQYNLPQNIRALRMVRYMLGGSPVVQTALAGLYPTAYQLPLASLPAVSVSGFLNAGALNIGGEIVFYTSLDNVGNNFLGCTGGTGLYPAGTVISQAGGVWMVIGKATYTAFTEILEADVLNPTFQASVPSVWAQFGTTFRLYPTPGLQAQLELTGSQKIPAPIEATDINFWTEDAAWLVIWGTCAKIRAGYLSDPQGALAAAQFEQDQYNRLKKTTFDLGGPKIIRSYL